MVAVDLEHLLFQELVARARSPRSLWSSPSRNRRRSATRRFRGENGEEGRGGPGKQRKALGKRGGGKAWASQVPSLSNHMGTLSSAHQAPGARPTHPERNKGELTPSALAPEMLLPSLSHSPPELTWGPSSRTMVLSQALVNAGLVRYHGSYVRRVDINFGQRGVALMGVR